jgi:hypothetical protein
LGTEDREESYFNGERFLNIATKMIAQVLQTTDALQNFGAVETACERIGFLPCAGQITALHIGTRPKNVRPPGE